jgi:hypothetical protein
MPRSNRPVTEREGSASPVSIQEVAGNPTENVLGSGVTPEHVATAVRQSGYPLQSLVAQELRELFGYVEEEWGFVDADGETPRALDIYAYQDLGACEQNRLITPGLQLFVECKRASLPYVFFPSITRTPDVEFPLISGVPNTTISMTVGAQRETVSLVRALEVDDFSLLQSPPVCASFTRAAKRGKEGVLELSGEEVWKGIVLPVAGALRYSVVHQRAWKPADRQAAAMLKLGVCVIDAPMVLAEHSVHGDRLTMVPWVRLVRQEAVPRARMDDPPKWLSHTIDVVHRGFLRAYVLDFVFPFAAALREKLDEHAAMLFSGRRE